MLRRRKMRPVLFRSNGVKWEKSLRYIALNPKYIKGSRHLANAPHGEEWCQFLKWFPVRAPSDYQRRLLKGLLMLLSRKIAQTNLYRSDTGPPEIICEGRGRARVQFGPMTVGAQRKPPKVPLATNAIKGFGSTLGLAHHIDQNLDIAASLRPVVHSDLRSQDALLTAAGTAGIFKVSFYRGSEHTPSMRQTAIAANRGGLICFETGQGAGVTGLRSLCWVIGMAHSVGLRVVVHVAGSADRLVRTGMYLAISVLENAGVEVRFAKGRAGDNPHEEGLQQSRERYRTVAGRLEKRINRFVKRLARKGLEPGFELRLPESVLKIRGIRSTLAAGAGLDFISALEVSDLTKASRTVRTMAMNSAAFRPVMGADGFWLVEPGLRARKGLVTKITPILVEGYEGECLALLRRRWPSATFGKEIVLPHPGSDPDVSWLNILNLQIESQTIYAAIDHASVHWGSPLDLDVWFRQHRSVLMTVLPSTHLFPDIGINAVRHCSNALMKLSKRMKP